MIESFEGGHGLPSHQPVPSAWPHHGEPGMTQPGTHPVFPSHTTPRVPPSPGNEQSSLLDSPRMISPPLSHANSGNEKSSWCIPPFIMDVDKRSRSAAQPPPSAGHGRQGRSASSIASKPCTMIPTPLRLLVALPLRNISFKRATAPDGGGFGPGIEGGTGSGGEGEGGFCGK
eukprot:scaffold10794_cov66-Phaeocystis_antarctica.AAC.11